MKVDVILGLQWGDEGKGKIVDFLADRYDIVCRFQVGQTQVTLLKWMVKICFAYHSFRNTETKHT